MRIGKAMGFRTRVALPYLLTALAILVLGAISVNTSRNCFVSINKDRAFD